MSVWTGRETDNADMIKGGTKTLFIAEKEAIGQFIIGGVDGHLAYCTTYPNIDWSYPSRRRRPEYIVLEAKEEDGAYYFTLLDDDEKIRISTEDYFFGDRRLSSLPAAKYLHGITDDPDFDIDREYAISVPGEILVSNNRERESLKTSYGAYQLYSGIKSSYVESTLEEIIKHPLTVRLSDITSIDSFPSSERIMDYNRRYKESIKERLMQQKLDAQINLDDQIRRLEITPAPSPKKLTK